MIDNKKCQVDEVNLNYQIDSTVSLVSVSSGIETVLGYSAEDFMDGSITFMDRLHKDDTDIADILFSPQTTSKRQITNLRLRHQDGRIRCIKASYTKSTGTEKEGKHTNLNLLLQDAKSLPRTMNYVADVMEFRVMMENTDDFIYFKDRNHVFTGASQTLVAICDPSEHWTDLLGRTDYDVFQEELADIYYKLEKQVFSGTLIAHEIQDFQTKEGERGWIDNRKYPIENDVGELIGLYGIARDITLQKKAEIELKKRLETEEKLRESEKQLFEQSKMASMGEMIGNISHQWRQPLSVIGSLSSNIQLKKTLGTLTDDKLNDSLKGIDDSVQYLSQTIDTFRDFIKEEKEFKEVILQERINTTLNIIAATLNTNHIKLINNIDYSNPVKMTLIVGELSQVIINIINNAKDIISERFIENPWIKIDLKKLDDKVTITIEDNGGGIPKDILPKIFDPYFTTKHQSQGTGLGLHISYKIVVESLKGKLYANNTENGAKFYIELPYIF